MVKKVGRKNGAWAGGNATSVPLLPGETRPNPAGVGFVLDWVGFVAPVRRGVGGRGHFLRDSPPEVSSFSHHGPR